MATQPLLEKYRQFLSLKEDTKIISLLEGSTPLVKAWHLPEKLGLNCNLYFKIEGLNPTGSFKDRGMTMAVTKAVEAGSKAIICASTGNTSAAAAAYAARAGIKAYVLIPEGKIAMGKLSQALIYGAEVIQIEGNFDEALKLVVEISNSSPITLVNSINPYRIEGQKTAAYEVCDALGTAPDIHIVPVGNAGNITAYWYGYKDYHKLGKTKVLPKMVGCQAEGSAPFVIGKFVDNPETVATAIRIGHPASWDKAQVIKQESNGVFYSVTDKQIIEAQQLLASTEGIFCEPASAASLAGLIANKDRLNIQEGANIVLTLTGNGLKDTDTVMQYIPYRGKIVKPTIENVKNAIFG